MKKLFLLFLLACSTRAATVVTTSPPVSTNMVLVGNGVSFFAANTNTLGQVAILTYGGSATNLSIFGSSYLADANILAATVTGGLTIGYDTSISPLNQAIDGTLLANQSPNYFATVDEMIADGIKRFGKTYFITSGDSAGLYALCPDDLSPTNGVTIFQPFNVATSSDPQRLVQLVSQRNTKTLTNFAQLVAINPLAIASSTGTTNMTDTVLTLQGYYTPGDGGAGIYTWTTNQSGTNAYGGKVAVLGGAWKLLPANNAIDVRQFGVLADNNTNNATDNATRLNSLFTYAATTGDEVLFPSGATVVNNPVTAANVTKIRGVGAAAGGPLQSEIKFVNPAADGITGLVGFTPVEDINLRGINPYVADATTNVYLLKWTGSGAGSYVRNVQLSDWWGGIYVATAFDILLDTVSTDGVAQHVYFGSSGSQSHMLRTAFRGGRRMYLDDATPITGSYASGTNLTVLPSGAGAVFNTGDMIRPLTITGVSNPISSQFLWRKVMGKSGDTIFLDSAWPGAASDITSLWRAMGKNCDAINCSTELVSWGLNIEWGAWHRMIYAERGSIGNISVDGAHYEGIVWDYPSEAPNMHDGVLVNFTFPSYLNIVNCEIYNSLGINLVGTSAGLTVNNYAQRNINTLTTPQRNIFVARALGLTSQFPISVNNADVFGGGYLPTLSLTNAIAKNETLKADTATTYQERFGINNMTRYVYSTVPTNGAWVAGDVVVTPNARYVCTHTGMLATPTGTFKVRSGSQVVVSDSTFRNAHGIRYSFLLGGVDYLIDWLTRQPLVSTTLSATANAGDRVITTPSTLSANPGDYAVIDFAGTFEDVRISAIVGTSVFLTQPLASTHSSGATLDVGLHISAASGTDQTSLTAPVYSMPTFVMDLSLDSTNALYANGVLSEINLGTEAGGTALNLFGGTSGASIAKLFRTGQHTIGLRASGGLLIYDEDLGHQLLGIGQDSVRTNYVTLSIGGTTTANPPLNGQVKAESESGTDVAGGILELTTGLGAGNNVTNYVAIRAPKAQASGSTPQVWSDAAKFDFNSSTASDTTVELTYWDGGTWPALARVKRDNSSLLTLGSHGDFSWDNNILTSVAGKGFQVKEGSNARMGTATLVGGTVTVSNTSVTANTRIFITSNTDGGTPGWLRVSARNVGTDFTITSSSAIDTSTVAWLLLEPAP